MKKPFHLLLKSKAKDLYPLSITNLRAKYKSNESLDLNKLADDYLDLIKYKAKKNYEELNNFYLSESKK